MINANVLVAEDRLHIRELVHIWLDKAGHTVVHEATTFAEAIEAVDTIASGDMPCDVVVLDGDLSGRGVRDNSDAREVLSRIRKHELGVKVIGFSAGEPLSDEGIDVDRDLDKLKVRSIPDLIAEF